LDPICQEQDLLRDQPALLRAITLNETQWDRVQKSRSFRTRVPKRVVWPDRHTEAIISSYHQDLIGRAQLVPRMPPHRPRFLTPRECARLQGFPDWFLTSRTGDAGGSGGSSGGSGGGNSGGGNEWWRFYPLIGNAVAPPVIQSIGEAIATALDLAGVAGGGNTAT
jgi:site-specific DNA-cytosine methylase